MKAQEIMTKDVISVAQTATVKEISKLMIDNRISAVPVVDEEAHVRGIVSESDLCHRAETSTEHKRKWWLEAFTGADTLAREFIKEHGLTAQDIMSRVVISVHEDADLAKIADVLDAHRIRRTPVTRDGRLVGIVSRSDLVRALASMNVSGSAERSDDGALQRAVYQQIRSQPWLTSTTISVTIKDGVVELWGVVDTDDQRQALRVMAEGVDGIKRVESNVILHPGYTV